MSYRSRVYRQRNTNQHENEQSKDSEKFFSKSTEKTNQSGKGNAFFQAKSNDATGGEDALEKEADKQADQVTKPDPVKDKKDETIQKLSTPEDDKQTSTNDERMKQDKDKQS